MRELKRRLRVCKSGKESCTLSFTEEHTPRRLLPRDTIASSSFFFVMSRLRPRFARTLVATMPIRRLSLMSFGRICSCRSCQYLHLFVPCLAVNSTHPFHTACVSRNQFHDVLPGSSIELANIDARAIYKDIETKGSHDFVCATNFT